MNSILAKVPQSSYRETSINKWFKRVFKYFNKYFKYIEPVISDQRFWRILRESTKPELFISSQVRSPDILDPYENAPDKEAKTRSTGSSYIFAQALSTPRTLSPMQKRAQLAIAKKKTIFRMLICWVARNVSLLH